VNEVELQDKIDLLERQKQHVEDDLIAFHHAIKDAIFTLRKIDMWYEKLIKKYVNGEANK